MSQVAGEQVWRRHEDLQRDNQPSSVSVAGQEVSDNAESSAAGEGRHMTISCLS